MARRNLGPAALAVAQAVQQAVTAEDRTLLVACSGGADSLALTAATRWVADRQGTPYGVIIVDHRLQPGSGDIAEETHRQLQSFGVADVTVTSVDVTMSGQGVEAAARAARYAALDAEASRRDATVLLGHTLDDQAETVLLGLARGSGTRSLAGMRPRSGRYLRPLLELRRAVTEQACAEWGLRWWQDPHNLDRSFARSRVRHQVLPTFEEAAGPGIAAALARTARLARDDADLLDEYAAQADPGTTELDCGLLAGLPAALRARVLRRWLTRHGAADLSWQHVAAVEQLVLCWHGQQEIHVPGAAVTRHGGALHCRRLHDPA